MDEKRAEQLVEIGCIVCLLHDHRKVAASIHHLTGIKYRALGKKASDKHTIPLCFNHHQGNDGVHVMGMRPWEAKYGTQSELLERVNDMITERNACANN